MWKFVIIPISVAIGAANYIFWLRMYEVIGNWSLLGLILTAFGLVPICFSMAILEIWTRKYSYSGVGRFEIARANYKKWYLRTQLSFWDSLSGRQFEHEVARLLSRSGYEAKVTPASNDKGVDVILNDGTLVQCKAHNSKVSPAIAREMYGTLKHFKANRAILIAKNGFTKGVYDFVKDKPVLLWDVSILIEMQKKLDN